MNKNLIETYKQRILRDNRFIKRDIFDRAKKQLEKTNIVLLGLRKVGKTILAEQLASEYLKSDNDSSSLNSWNIFYINLKSFPEITYETIQRDINGKRYKVVLIDEIQRIDKWSVLFKELIKSNPNTKFIATSSNSSSLLSSNSKEYKVINVNPLSFNEYKKIWVGSDEDTWSNSKMHQYLYFGSYPKDKEGTEPIIQYNEMILDKIVSKIVLEDNSYIKMNKLIEFAKAIAKMVGSELNVTKLARDSELSRVTCYTYLDILESSMFIKRISKYVPRSNGKPDTTVNYSKEMIYFTDKSMVSYFGGESHNNMKESLIKNQVLSFLSKKYEFNFGSKMINYFQNDKKEIIDFIIEDKKIIIEVIFKEGLDVEKISKKLNSKLTDETAGYKKIVISKYTKEISNGWKFIPLIDLMEKGDINV